jgi:hypothetical protein
MNNEKRIMTMCEGCKRVASDQKPFAALDLNRYRVKPKPEGPCVECYAMCYPVEPEPPNAPCPECQCPVSLSRLHWPHCSRFEGYDN